MFPGKWADITCWWETENKFFVIFPLLVRVHPFTFALVNCLISAHKFSDFLSLFSWERGLIEQLGGQLVSKQGQSPSAGDSPFSQISIAENMPEMQQIKFWQLSFPCTTKHLSSISGANSKWAAQMRKVKSSSCYSASCEFDCNNKQGDGDHSCWIYMLPRTYWCSLNEKANLLSRSLNTTFINWTQWRRIIKIVSYVGFCMENYLYIKIIIFALCWKWISCSDNEI